MDAGAKDTATALRVAAEPAPAPAASRRRPRLAVDMTLLAVVGVLLLAAIGTGAAAIYREFYSPAAFVERYLGPARRRAGPPTRSRCRASRSTPPNSRRPACRRSASDALLRRAALATLTDIEVGPEQVAEDGSIRITAGYHAGAFPGTTTFEVQRDGWVGVAPTWRFVRSPLAIMDVSVKGSMTFEVNGFVIDKRQVSPDGVDADPLAPVALLVFSPGIYSVSVDTPISATRGVAVLSDSPLANVPVDLQAFATPAFVDTVQQRVEEFLSSCATQEVLQPTACPFGFVVQDRIVSPPKWAIVSQPTVSVVPDGAGWRIPAAEAVAHIDVEIRSLFDGSVSEVAEDVPFVVTGSIAVLPDGTASITVSGPDPR